MSIGDLSSFQLLKPGLRAYLAAYTPTFLSQRQWSSVRRDVVDLVARCKPGTKNDVKVMASNLCRFIAELAGEVDELYLWHLLTPLNVARVLDRYEGQGLNANTRAQHQTQLRRCLRVGAGLPARIERGTTKSRELDPYSAGEFHDLAGAISGAPDEIRVIGYSALVLGIGHGIVIPDTESITTGVGGCLPWPDGFLGVDAGLSHPLRDVVVSGFTGPDWDRVRTWLLKNRPSAPDLLVSRLRDTWLAGPMQDPATTKSATQLMTESGVGRRFIESLAIMARPMSSETSGILLRNF